CDASIELIGPAGTRTVAMGDFVLGPFATAREPEEILVAIDVPARRDGEGRGYAKIAFFERPAASVGVRLAVREGRLAQARVAVGSMTETAVLVPEVAHAILGAEATSGGLDAVLGTAREALSVVDAEADHNGSADYKRHLAGVLLARAAHDALTEAVADA